MGSEGTRQDFHTMNLTMILVLLATLMSINLIA